MKQKIFVLVQVILIVVVISGVLLFYPRASLTVDGNRIVFNSINANVIIISENSDFRNPRYIDIENNASFSLRSGKYYWKAGNRFIESFSNEFVVDSNVGLEIIEKEEGTELKNVGDVKINVTRTEGGGFVGHIILEPEESEDVGNSGRYTGGQVNEI